MERFFQICDNCGAWRETTAGVIPVNPLSQFWADYDHRFFIEEHLLCQHSPQDAEAGHGITAVRNCDAGFEMPDPAKEWKPEKCPGYRPPQTPTRITKTDLSASDFIGCWLTNNFGGFDNEAWVFEAEGHGTVVSIRLEPFKHTFKWQLTPKGELTLELAEPVGFPPLLFFRAGSWSVEITDEINAYGEQGQFLTIPFEERALKLRKKEHGFAEKLEKRIGLS